MEVHPMRKGGDPVSTFEWAGLAYRNPSYVTKNARSSWAVSKVMKKHRQLESWCAWCGRKKRLQVHHIVPVSVAPEQAADPANLITLCAKRCHITVGHAGNYANSYMHKVRLICTQNNPMQVESSE